LTQYNPFKKNELDNARVKVLIPTLPPVLQFQGGVNEFD